jgi:hypothetical protein
MAEKPREKPRDEQQGESLLGGGCGCIAIISLTLAMILWKILLGAY